jgi:hypothetical protein
VLLDETFDLQERRKEKPFVLQIPMNISFQTTIIRRT